MNEPSPQFVEILNLGEQPISNRYLLNSDSEQCFHSISLGQCSKSGLLGLINKVPQEELVPTYDWLTYAEPEPHLDTLVSLIMEFDPIDSSSVIAGVSFKDDSTLARFNKYGCKTWRIDENEDLGITSKGVGVESVQAKLHAKSALKISNKYAKPDVLIARHIVEHAYDLKEFLTALKKLMKPDGYLVIELPDCSKSLERKDYTMLWEEHLYYFTPNTFKYWLNKFGFIIEKFINYPYPMENSLVAIVKLQVKKNPIHELVSTEEFELAQDYAKSFSELKQKTQQVMKNIVQQYGEVAFLGAGHLACTYIWLFELTEYISFIVDDDKNKQGKFMPGSALPIVNASTLLKGDVRVCLLSVNPLSEAAVINNNQMFIQQEGHFLSVFPNSELSLLRRTV